MLKIKLSRPRKSAMYMLIGLLFNLAMALAKFFIGFSSGSLTIIIDSINNFIDVVFNFVATIAFFIVAAKESEEMPLGYGRAEYLASFLLSIFISASGVYFLFRSISSIIAPASLFFDVRYMVILIVSVLAKIGMGLLFAYANKDIKSYVFKGVVVDSFIDASITTLVILAFYLSKFRLVIDSVFGIIISIIFIILGVKLFSVGFKSVLGKDHFDESYKGKIKDAILNCPGVKELVSIVYHDYGFAKIQVVAKVFLNAEDDNICEISKLKTQLKKEYKVDLLIDTLPEIPEEK